MPYTLVDPPVGPYSRIDDLRAWAAECERRAQTDPDDDGWALARTQALAWLAQAEAQRAR